jgi:hypothetical protein
MFHDVCEWFGGDENVRQRMKADFVAARSRDCQDATLNYKWIRIR